MVETALSSDSSIDQEVLDLAEDWQATSVVAAAVQLAWQVLAPVMTTPMVEFAHAHRPDGRSERRLRLRPTSGDARPPEVMEMVRAIPGMQSRAAYLSALAFPSSGYLAERGQTRANRLMGGLRRLSR